MKANPLEIIWSLSAFTGFVVSVLTLIVYVGYNRTANSFKNKRSRDDARQLSHDYLWAEGRRMAIHILSLQVGVWALLLADPARCNLTLPHYYVVYGVDVIFSLIAINVITALGSIGAFRAHLRWKRRMEDEEAFHASGLSS